MASQKTQDRFLKLSKPKKVKFIKKFQIKKLKIILTLTIKYYS